MKPQYTLGSTTQTRSRGTRVCRCNKNDISWLGYSWKKITYSSDNFDQLYEWALYLISIEKAYVDSQTSEEIASQKEHQQHLAKTVLSVIGL
ncbi:MAG: hypothetical protein CM15mP121_1020 [Bacteroidota bacterium]|nr:MAG: hypothetical protein CM15mP121_1020 [Bacteroidota bacterium]